VDKLRGIAAQWPPLIPIDVSLGDLVSLLLAVTMAKLLLLPDTDVIGVSRLQ